MYHRVREKFYTHLWSWAKYRKYVMQVDKRSSEKTTSGGIWTSSSYVSTILNETGRQGGTYQAAPTLFRYPVVFYFYHNLDQSCWAQQNCIWQFIFSIYSVGGGTLQILESIDGTENRMRSWRVGWCHKNNLSIFAKFKDCKFWMLTNSVIVLQNISLQITLRLTYSYLKPKKLWAG